MINDVVRKQKEKNNFKEVKYKRVTLLIEMGRMNCCPSYVDGVSVPPSLTFLLV